MKSRFASTCGKKYLAAPVLAMMLSISTAACTGEAMNEEPPDSQYSEAEVIPEMESAAAVIVAALPDFPGFESRSWSELPCSHNGVDDSDYVNVEIRYGFSDAVSSDPLVREDYVDALRAQWTGQGYELGMDESFSAGKNYDLEARRGDGIVFWYRVWEGVSLLIQSGCVPKSDPGEIEYIPPTGGLVPGSKWDTTLEGIQGLPEVPIEDSTEEATESGSPTGMVPPWARDPDPTETGPNPYSGEL
jgi:hypothetical protein